MGTGAPTEKPRAHGESLQYRNSAEQARVLAGRNQSLPCEGQERALCMEMTISSMTNLCGDARNTFAKVSRVKRNQPKPGSRASAGLSLPVHAKGIPRPISVLSEVTTFHHLYSNAALRTWKALRSCSMAAVVSVRLKLQHRMLIRFLAWSSPLSSSSYYSSNACWSKSFPQVRKT